MIWKSLHSGRLLHRSDTASASQKQQALAIADRSQLIQVEDKKEMNRKKVLIYGDSNTYGYDRREFSGGRYPKEFRWTTILQDRLKSTHEFIVDGMNGRPLPAVSGSHMHLKRLFAEHAPLDLFAVMLGTNDILLTTSPDARIALERMDHFLSWLKEEAQLSSILVIAPVYIGSGQDRYYALYHEQSILMNQGFEKLARKHQVQYADASKWDVQLAFDQVHFSPEGCRTFAEHMIPLL